jgi:hypothetical protein
MIIAVPILAIHGDRAVSGWVCDGDDQARDRRLEGRTLPGGAASRSTSARGITRKRGLERPPNPAGRDHEISMNMGPMRWTRGERPCILGEHP